MRIRTNIFAWLFLATILPLTALTLGATYYYEYSQQRDVKREVITSLDNIGVNIDQLLRNKRNLALGISRAPAVQAYIPVLQGIKQNQIPTNAGILWRRVNRYFEGFQTILPGVFILRILDEEGNTLAMVNHNRRAAPIYESVSNIRYVEQELADTKFAAQLANLPVNEVSMLRLPHNHIRQSLNHSYLLLDAVVPLYANNNYVGALTLTVVGEDIDRILNHSTRLYDGQFMMLELNSDVAERHGLILYDQQQQLHLAQVRSRLYSLTSEYAETFLEQAGDKGDGLYSIDKQRQLFFTTINPYPNHFVTWVIASRVNRRNITEPFYNIRIGVILFALTALVVSLLLTTLGSRRIAEPLCKLASQIKNFADGERHQRADNKQPIDEVQALATSFNYLADTLHVTETERDAAQQMVLRSNKLASIGQMAAGIGHEINNPLNNILSYSKLLFRNLEQLPNEVDETTRQQLQADIQSLKDETLRASDIVRGILNFARQVPPQYSRFEVTPWLEHTLQLVQQAANNRNILLKLNTHYAGKIDGDSNQLQQALVNLLLNAIQASPEQGEVCITSKQQKQHLVIEVDDQGPGIDDETLQNIFDPFFTTKAEGEGSGLGLSISLGIVERHHGKLVIANKPERGVCAILSLPINVNQAENHD